MSPDFILYTDFSCPFCYALSERLTALHALERIDWRGVQHAPHFQVPMATAGPNFRLELEREVQSVRRLALEVPISLPRGKPNTGAAIHAVAAAMQVNHSNAHALATLLYRALWQHGSDISNPAIIESLMRQAGLQESSSRIDSTGVQSIIQSWRAEWSERGVGSVPELVRHDGESLIGLVDRVTLQRFLEFPRH